MTDVLFYHLTETPLERTLPSLLEKSLARGWTVRVQGSSMDHIEMLSTHLWTYSDDGFLPHGTASQPHADQQPILLNIDADNTNQAQVLMLVDGAPMDIAAAKDYERVCVFFDGNDTDRVSAARATWKSVKDTGLEAKYWAQENGSWTQKA